MKTFLPILALILAIAGLCIWDGINTHKIFSYMENESEKIYSSLVDTEEQISDENLKEKVYNLSTFWTKEMDTLCISMSRKDLQPVSDYMQYLVAAIHNDSLEDAVTYSRLLYYNILGLNEMTGITFINLI